MTDGALLRAYAGTVWTLYLPEGSCTVRLPGSRALPAELLPLAVVSAYNPRSVPRSVTRNRLADRALERRLRHAGAAFFRSLAGGTGPEAACWDEPGFALPRADRASAVRLARRFGQNALLWLDADGTASLVATRPGFCGKRVGETLGAPPPPSPEPSTPRCSSSTV